MRSNSKTNNLRTQKSNSKQIHTRDKILINLERKFGNILEDLKYNRLYDLNMQNANLVDQDLKVLCQIIQNASNLRYINLKKNKISEKGVLLVCEAIRNLQIEQLDFSYNQISPICFAYFKSLKKYNPFIKIINVKFNDIKNSMLRNKAIEFKKFGVILKLD